MSDSAAGPSGVKRPRLCKKTYQYRKPLTDKELEQYLLDSDDDIADPDFIDSDFEQERESSDSSEGEEKDNIPPALDEPNPDTSSNISNVSNSVTSVILVNTEVPHRPTASDSVVWSTVEKIPKQIPFTRQKEMLIQPNGKL